MSSLWTNAEVLYSMPAVGATKTTTAQSLVTSTTAFEMPPLAQLWTPSQMVGKVIQVYAGGTYDATAVTSTLGMYYDATQGSVGTLIAGTGAVTVVSETTGIWNMNIWLSCISVGSNTSGWMTSGEIMYGLGNNAGTGGASQNTCMVGGANTAGVPTALALATTASTGYWELWSTWGTAPTAFVCSQFIIMAMN